MSTSPYVMMHAFAKEFTLLYRDRIAILLALALPVIAIGVFGMTGLGAAYGHMDPIALVLAFSIAFPAFMSSSTALVRERHQGTLTRLAKTPAPLAQLILGKLVANTSLAMLQAFVTVAVAGWWLSELAETGLFGLFLFLTAFGVVCHAFGLVVSAVAKSDGQASQLVATGLLVMILLSGFLEPLESLPVVLASLAGWLPFTQGYQGLVGLVRNEGGVGGWVARIFATTLAAFVVSVASLRWPGGRR